MIVIHNLNLDQSRFRVHRAERSVEQDLRTTRCGTAVQGGTARWGDATDQDPEQKWLRYSTNDDGSDVLCRVCFRPSLRRDL